jgi:hypothetical protein
LQKFNFLNRSAKLGGGGLRLHCWVNCPEYFICILSFFKQCSFHVRAIKLLFWLSLF